MLESIFKIYDVMVISSISKGALMAYEKIEKPVVFAKLPTKASHDLCRVFDLSAHLKKQTIFLFTFFKLSQ